MGEDIRDFVRETYARAITRKTGCCGGGANPVTGRLYGPEEVTGLPRDARTASFGCGNPTALADLHAGEVVLDLGSGAGLDVLLSARRVGPTGRVYGLDMTDEMLAAARANQAEAGLANVEFRKGYLEDIPLPDSHVDVIVSNCVINLAADKDTVLREAFRVLKPGGRWAVSDIVLTRPLPPRMQESLALWAGCLAGALVEEEYREKLAGAGFTDVGIEVARVYDITGPAATMLTGMSAAESREWNGSIVSAFVRARKPPLALTAGRDYRVRPAGSDDLAAIGELLRVAGLPTAGAAENIDRYFVADRDGPVGVVGLEQAGDAFLLRSLAVNRDWWKSGLGAALVDRALRRVREDGGTAVYLLTNTAENYLQRWGFSRIERGEIPENLIKNSALDGIGHTAGTCMKLEMSGD